MIARARLTDIDEALALTHDQDVRVRRGALRRLCPAHVRANYPEIWDRVLEMAEDEDAGIRAHVLQLLVEGSPKEREAEIVEVLVALQRDADERLARRARAALAYFRRNGRVNIL